MRFSYLHRDSTMYLGTIPGLYLDYTLGQRFWATKNDEEGKFSTDRFLLYLFVQGTALTKFTRCRFHQSPEYSTKMGCILVADTECNLVDR